eukprot:Hpha_TRINITY_DN10489_c0_g1::TRINITY_DN10489_c0_g1_i2::g.193307::m.193307
MPPRAVVTAVLGALPRVHTPRPKVLRELGRANDGIVLAGMASLPYVCRAVEYGRKVMLYGLKERGGVATLPSWKVGEVAQAVSEIVGVKEVYRFPSFVVNTLTPTNPIMHTGRNYGLFGPYAKEKVYTRNPGFYDECDEVSGEWLSKLDAENQKIAAAADRLIPGSVGGQVLPLNKYMKWSYTDDITKWDTPRDCYRTNRALAGLGGPMKKQSDGTFVPDYTSRYFTEDIPYGLLANKGLAELLGVPTPAINEVIAWAGDKLGKRWLVQGRVNPNELPQMTPQAFGFTLADLKRLYAQRPDESKL